MINPKQEFEACLAFEINGKNAPDARRCVRDERIALQAAMQRRDSEAIAERAAEARRVRLMWAEVSS